MQNLAALGDFSNVTVRNMKPNVHVGSTVRPRPCGQTDSSPIKFYSKRRSSTRPFARNNINLRDAVGEIQEIMQKGLSLQEATDYWITWVLSGGRAQNKTPKATNGSAKAREDILAQEKAKSDEYINFLTGQIQDPTMKEAAKDAATEYAKCSAAKD